MYVKNDLITYYVMLPLICVPDSHPHNYSRKIIVVPVAVHGLPLADVSPFLQKNRAGAGC
jgi:hypothetical protein